MANLREKSPARQVTGWSRRELGRFAGLFAIGGALPSRRLSAAERTASGLEPVAEDGPNLYRDLGVRPLINCRGTVTVIGGSIELPEVRAAKSLANQVESPRLQRRTTCIGRR